MAKTSEIYTVMAIAIIVGLVLQFLITRYYVSTTVSDDINEKIKKSNKKVLKTMNATFEKYMGQPTMTNNDGQYDSHEYRDRQTLHDSRDLHNSRNSHNGRDRHNSYDRYDEDSIEDPADYE